VIRLATRFELHGLRDHIADLLGENIQPVLEKWGDATAEQLVAAWRAFHETTVVPDLAAALVASDPFVEFRQLCLTAEVTRPGFSDHVQRVLDVLEQLAHGDARAAVAELRELAKVQGVCSKKDWTNPEDFERFKETCKAVRGLIDKSPLNQQLQTEHLLEAAETGLELLHLVADIADRYEVVKQAQNALEFDDLLIRAHRLLTDPRHRGLQQSLVGRTRLLMVDEFQDTDPLQVAIVQAFCGDDWSRQGLFVVGDHKQSIYRFRGAEPRVSNELRESLADDCRLSLTTNFRSQPAILDFVNALFQGAFAKDYEPLRPSRPQSTPIPAVEFLWAVGEDAESDEEISAKHGRAQRMRAREARFIAQRLAQLIDSQEPIISAGSDGGESEQLRPLELGDVAILMRSLSDVAIYENALRQQGLVYYLAGGHAFYAQQEIYDVLHLLRSIASSADDLSLAGALRSPIFSLLDESLFWLVEEHGSLNRGLFAAELPPQLTAEERTKVARTAATLGELRAVKDQLLVAELLNLALERTGYDAALQCEFLGERKLANVRKLVEQARTIDRTRPGDLAGFITQLSEFVVRAPKEPLAATRAEGNVIRLMTIHNAKGLEFPLVVVPDLERKTRFDAGPEFDERLGPLVPSAADKAVVGLDLYRATQRQEDLAERQRLLYVACTRAADYLILSSSVANLDKPQSDWLRLISDRFDLSSGRCLATLPQGYGAPQVRVIADQPASDRKSRGKSRGTDLVKLVEKTRRLAAAGQGVVPKSVRPIPSDVQARRQFSFSRLSGLLVPDSELAADQSAESPATTPTTLDPRGLGTLVHEVLERIDFTGENDVEGLCRFLAPLHLEVGWQQAAATAAELVNGLLGSPRAAEIAQARSVRREVEFLLPWPEKGTQLFNKELRPLFPCLRGYIDCLYQDAVGGWHLIDYKSNQVSAETVPAAAVAYALQMFVYREACRQALGVAPVECTLYFLRPGREFAFEFDDAQSREHTTQLTRAIEAQLSSATLGGLSHGLNTD
jgi:ATP-dependent helicase/nuclease subunit A